MFDLCIFTMIYYHGSGELGSQARHAEILRDINVRSRVLYQLKTLNMVRYCFPNPVNDSMLFI